MDRRGPGQLSRARPHCFAGFARDLREGVEKSRWPTRPVHQRRSLPGTDQRLGTSVAQMEYRSIAASLRPPRFVVGYRPGQDWVYSARHVVASISRVWGGNGAVIAPVRESAVMNELLALFMRAYDPDHIAGHVQVLADLAHDAPEIYGRAAQKPTGQGE